MKQVTPVPAAPRRTRSAAPEPAHNDVWGSSQIFRADFVPRDSQLESIDALHEPHVEAVRALEQAVERLRDQRAEYAKQDQEFKDSLVGGTKPAEVVGDRQRQLTLEALEQAVAEARAAVVASAELVLSTVADHPSVVDDLDTVRSNTRPRLRPR